MRYLYNQYRRYGIIPNEGLEHYRKNTQAIKLMPGILDDKIDVSVDENSIVRIIGS